MSSSLRCCALAASLFLVVPAHAEGLADLDARTTAGLDDVGRRVLDADPDGSYTAVLTTDIVWGQTLGLTLSAYALVHASGDESFRSVIDMSNTTWWDGVVSATVEGQAVDDFTVTSSSGLDFRRSYGLAPAVPEPEAWALMLLGVGLLRWRKRHASERGDPLSSTIRARHT